MSAGTKWTQTYISGELQKKHTANYETNASENGVHAHGNENEMSTRKHC